MSVAGESCRMGDLSSVRLSKLRDAGAKQAAADRAARAQAEAAIQCWNDQLALGRDMLWSPTIRAALLAGTPWLDVFCPGCARGK
jgi:hypothetical protein